MTRVRRAHRRSPWNRQSPGTSCDLHASPRHISPRGRRLELRTAGHLGRGHERQERDEREIKADADAKGALPAARGRARGRVEWHPDK